MGGKLANTMMLLGRINTTAETGFAYDQMLERSHKVGADLIMGGVNGLIDQTRTIERIITTLDLDQIMIEGSDSLDDPGAVFK